MTLWQVFCYNKTLNQVSSLVVCCHDCVSLLCWGVFFFKDGKGERERVCECARVCICVCVCDRQSQTSRQMFPSSLLRLSEKDWQQLDQCQTHTHTRAHRHTHKHTPDFFFLIVLCCYLFCGDFSLLLSKSVAEQSSVQLLFGSCSPS